jgi:(E)-4-hydroxy-3-methylbut-2-enyl-diphosphate synthase
MWKDRLSFADLEGERGNETISRVKGLAAMGCRLLRFAVPDLPSAEVLGELASRVSLPICADIHFDYKIALRCLDFPIAKLRINPGNIGSRQRVEEVVSKAVAKNVPIRIGVNAGSLPQYLQKRVGEGMGTVQALVQAALDELAVFDELGFANTVVSMKASGIADTVKANRLFRESSDVPIHAGVTEAGPLVAGTVRNAAALLPLLSEGIGDTLRVSLSDTMENEVAAAREILIAARETAPQALRDRLGVGVTLVSCPRCGRAGFDTHAFTERWMRRLYALDKDCAIAVMGCAVNGPGEARHADLGITGAGDSIVLFRRGKVIKTIRVKDDAEVDRVFGEELEKMGAWNYSGN